MKDLGFYNCCGGVNGDLPTELSSWDLIEAIRYLKKNDDTILKLYLSKELIISVGNLANFIPFMNYPTMGFLKDKNGTKILGEFIIDEKIQPCQKNSSLDKKIYLLYMDYNDTRSEIRSTLT